MLTLEHVFRKVDLLQGVQVPQLGGYDTCQRVLGAQEEKDDSSEIVGSIYYACHGIQHLEPHIRQKDTKRNIRNGKTQAGNRY